MEFIELIKDMLFILAIILPFFACDAIIITPVLTFLAVKRWPNKNNGKLEVDMNSFILTRMYRDCLFNRCEKKPERIKELYEGVFYGSFGFSIMFFGLIFSAYHIVINIIIGGG